MKTIDSLHENILKTSVFLKAAYKYNVAAEKGFDECDPAKALLNLILAKANILLANDLLTEETK